MGQNLGLFKCFLQSFFKKKPKITKYFLVKKFSWVYMVIKDYFKIELNIFKSKNIDFY